MPRIALCHAIGNSCERKRMKRFNAVVHVMFSDDFVLTLCAGDYVEPPDPNDLSLSKRAWERSVQLWRSQLRAIARRSSQ